MPGTNGSTKSGNGLNYVGIKFCQECNNMLYPRENKDTKTLFYACRNCDYTEETANMCIHVNKINDQDADELARIVPEVIHDPTLPRTKEHPCPSCSNREAVFFQGQSSLSAEDMRLYYVCCNSKCCHKWTE